MIVFELNVMAYGDEPMLKIFDFLSLSSEKVVGYEITKTEKEGQRFAMYWTEPNHKSKDYVPLPYEMKIQDMVILVSGWLQKKAEYGRQPDIDGSVKKGWRIVNHHAELGGMSDHWQVAAFVQPEWIEFHK